MLKNAAHSRCANCSKIDDHSAQKLLTKHTSMSMMSKRTWMSPSGVLPASQDAAAIPRSLRGILPPPPYSVAMTSIWVPSGGSPTGLKKLEVLALDEAGGCLDCLLLKFEIAHDDLRLFVAGPFGLPCDPEAAQVLAEGKESSENPVGPEFCAAKVFRALSEEPGSERVWRSQGRRRGTSRHRGLRNELRMAGWACRRVCASTWPRSHGSRRSGAPRLEPSVPRPNMPELHRLLLLSTPFRFLLERFSPGFGAHPQHPWRTAGTISGLHTFDRSKV